VSKGFLAAAVASGMPTKATTRKAYAKKRQGYSTSTAAGEFVREEMHHKKQGKHGKGESRKQAIAIGLSKARQAGLKVPRKRSGSRSASKRPSRSRSRSR
jgi:hypothetical protein